jgi:hypothetical protein
VKDEDKREPARGWRPVEKVVADNDDATAPKPAASGEATAPITMILPRRNRWKRPLVIAGALAAGSMIYLAAHPVEPLGSARRDLRAMAERDRDEAEASCAAKKWDACGRALDRAKELDPAGEDEQRVKKARGAIAAGVVGVRTDGEAP